MTELKPQLKDSLSLNYFTQSQNLVDNEKNLSMAQRAITHKDQVQSFRMLACKELRDHAQKNNQTEAASNSSTLNSTEKNSDFERPERLLLKVATLKKINTSIMEELFFNDAIGNVQIDSIIPSILGSQPIDDTSSSSSNDADTYPKKLKS